MPAIPSVVKNAPPTMGSGAGSEVTALGESLQAYACATRQFLGKDLTDVSQITNATIGDADCDRTLAACMKGLDEGWFHSVIVTANEIFKDVPDNSSSKFIFYRGGKLVGQVYSEFGRFRKESGIAGDDKWNPADIWMVKKGFKFQGDWPSLNDYNNYIYNEFAKTNLIGISLKKVPKGDAHGVIYNNGKPPLAEFTKFRAGTNMSDSKDVYIEFKSLGKQGEIQLRNFSSRPVPSSWQGEIKGKTAAGGKIGGGKCIEAATDAGIQLSELMVPQRFSSQIEKPNDATFKMFAMMFKDISGVKDTVDQLVVQAKAKQRQDKTWWMSKFLGVHYCYTIKKKKKEDEVTKWLFGYGSSSTKNSSIFIKYSS
jgi:hypothetical protein